MLEAIIHAVLLALGLIFPLGVKMYLRLIRGRPSRGFAMHCLLSLQRVSVTQS